MLRLVLMILGVLVSSFRSRHDLAVENLVLKQQLAAFKASSQRPRIRICDRAFWIAVRRLWTKWSDALIIVKPDTVVRWHRAGFRLFWLWISRGRGCQDRPAVDVEVRELIRDGRRQIVQFNVSEHPTAAWVAQQVREAFPFDTAPKYLILDRDSVFSAEVVHVVKAMGMAPTRTSYRAPWQNGLL